MQNPCISGFLYTRVGLESLSFDWLVKMWHVCFFEAWSHGVILCFPTRLKTRFSFESWYVL